MIPVYQRPYTWHREQCRQILTDIRTVAENEALGSHFLGSIVYLRTNITSTPHVLTVIDGQQRLTSLMLLCLALYNRARESGNTRFAEEFHEKFLINKYLENEEFVGTSHYATYSGDVGAKRFGGRMFDNTSRTRRVACRDKALPCLYGTDTMIFHTIANFGAIFGVQCVETRHCLVSTVQAQ